MKKYLIIGYSAAAVSAIRAIRTIDTDGEITVLSKENDEPYSKVLLTHYIAGHCSRESMFLLTPQEREALKYSVVFSEAEKLDTEKHSVITKDGTTLYFDELLVASGAAPSIPDEASRLLVEHTGLRTLEDADRIMEMAKPGGHVVIAGGGLVGVKLAAALCMRGVKADIVIGSDRILSKNTDREASLRIAKHMCAHGIGIYTGTNIVPEQNTQGKVTLDNGTDIKCDLVVYAKGVKPVTHFLPPAVLKNNAALTDSTMCTQIRHVYAAGDAAASYDILSGGYRNLAIWPHAVEQGRVAGVNMAGGYAEYKGSLSRNALEILGIPYIAIGVLNEDKSKGETAEIYSSKDVYIKRVFCENKLIGALLLGDVDNAGLMQAQIWKDHMQTEIKKGGMLV